MGRAVERYDRRTTFLPAIALRRGLLIVANAMKRADVDTDRPTEGPMLVRLLFSAITRAETRGLLVKVKSGALCIVYADIGGTRPPQDERKQ